MDTVPRRTSHHVAFLIYCNFYDMRVLGWCEIFSVHSNWGSCLGHIVVTVVAVSVECSLVGRDPANIGHPVC